MRIRKAKKRELREVRHEFVLEVEGDDYLEFLEQAQGAIFTRVRFEHDKIVVNWDGWGE